MARLTLARIVTAMPFVMLLAGCNREAPPAYVPPPPPAPGPGPANRPADQPPRAAAPPGEQLAIARACATDIERFCAGVPPRQGLVKECMKVHVAELSAGCFDAVMSAIAAAHAP
jgi:hypothetical protein